MVPVLWLIVAWAMLVLWPSPVFANIGLPMVAIYLPPAWLLLVPIVAIEGGYGIWRLKIPAGRAVAVQAAANCLSTLVGLPVTWVLLALGEVFLLERASRVAPELPLIVTTVLGAAWLGPGAEESTWMVPLAIAVLTVPFYAMSVVCEYVVVRRLMADLPRRSVRSWMIEANAVSYALLLVVILAGWVWPRTFERISAAMFPISEWLVTLVLRVGVLFQGR